MEYKALDDLKYIKKHFGEKMSHLCRDLFPSVLEYPGLLFHLLITHFNPSKSIYYDITKENKEQSFKKYIYSFANILNSRVSTDKSVRELLDSAGYELYECKTNEDIQKFKKYYAKNEELCTFRDEKRINGHHIFFIVKKNVDEIKREDFNSPKREDEYGVSVLDIQFDRGEKQRVSIKSRYNHTVNNPDATYSNNLENIVSGLTEAFEREYGFNIGYEYGTDFELDSYVKARDGKFYKYNYEINNIHYCPDNIIIKNGRVITDFKDKGRYTVFDYFILDTKAKKIQPYYPNYITIQDSFLYAFINITNISIVNKDGCREIEITTDNKYKAYITIDKDNRIIGYKNDNITSVDQDFLYRNDSLRKLDMPNLRSCGNDFLFYNKSLKELSLPSLRTCGNCFLNYNSTIKSIYLPKLRSCGNDFLKNNTDLKTINLPALQKCGSFFLTYNKELEQAILPSLKYCDHFFMENNKKLNFLWAPSLEKCGDDCLSKNNSLKILNLPKLKSIGHCFLDNNNSIEEIKMPRIKYIGNSFMCRNDKIKSLNLPSLISCGNSFLRDNNVIAKLRLPRLKSCGYYFLYLNKELTKLSLPNLEYCGSSFMPYNTILRSVRLPKLLNKGCDFLTFGLNNLKKEEQMHL